MTPPLDPKPPRLARLLLRLRPLGTRRAEVTADLDEMFRRARRRRRRAPRGSPLLSRRPQPVDVEPIGPPPGRRRRAGSVAWPPRLSPKSWCGRHHRARTLARDRRRARPCSACSTPRCCAPPACRILDSTVRVMRAFKDGIATSLAVRRLRDAARERADAGRGVAARRARASDVTRPGRTALAQPTGQPASACR